MNQKRAPACLGTKFRCVVSLIALSLLFGCASRPVGEKFENVNYASDPGETHVYIYSRGIRWAAKDSWVLAVNGRAEAVISTDSYHLIIAAPGTIEELEGLQVAGKPNSKK